MKKALVVSEILGDFLLPLLGYIWWGWDLYFILLFIIFDLSIRLFFAFFRKETRSAQLLLRPALFYLSFIIVGHFYIVLTEPTWRFIAAFSDYSTGPHSNSFAYLHRTLSAAHGAAHNRRL
jgi:hypothetical protein